MSVQNCICSSQHRSVIFHAIFSRSSLFITRKLIIFVKVITKRLLAQRIMRNVWIACLLEVNHLTGMWTSALTLTKCLYLRVTVNFLKYTSLTVYALETFDKACGRAVRTYFLWRTLLEALCLKLIETGSLEIMWIMKGDKFPS